MTLQILIDQSGHSAGVAGRAREDLAVGTPVTLQAVGGPFAAYQWSFVSKAIDIDSGVEATSAFTSPAAATTNVDPVDQPGTYMVQVAVDSGSGLGAAAADVARITFYAGLAGSTTRGPVATDPAEMPRRLPAYGEELEHNVPDAIDAGGNKEGWSREWWRIWAVLRRLYVGKDWASGRVHVAGGVATKVRGFNFASVAYLAVGSYQITLSRPLPDTNYLPIGVPLLNPVIAVADTILSTTVFTIAVADLAGTPVDSDFGFVVKLGKGE